MDKKGMDIKIEIGKGKPGPVTGMAQEAEMSDEQNYDAMSPTGNFTPKGLSALVKATNIMLPLFGQTGDYPMLNQPLKKLPTDFTRVLTMFKAATDDAIAEEVIGSDMAIDFEMLKDDSSLMLLAGKLNQLAKNKDFKKFLKEPPANETKGSEAGEEGGMPEEEMPANSSESMDSLFANRM